MAEWLFEAGIGENRAALVDDGAIIEAIIERDDDGARPGGVYDAVLRARNVAELQPNGEEVLLDRVPPRMSEGARLRLLVTREALPEPGKLKRAKGRAVSPQTPLSAAPALRQRIEASAWPVRKHSLFDGDPLERAGWSETLEEAVTGQVLFGENALSIGLTPAMTLIDLDGPDPDMLHADGARAAASAIRRLGIAGNIGIDFPTTESKLLRTAAATTFNETLPQPFEATAVNGFGFMQIIRPRERASLLELVQYDRVGAAARALLRHAQRAGVTGAVEITGHPIVTALLEARPAWLASLGRQLGGAVRLRSDAGLGIGGGHVSPAR